MWGQKNKGRWETLAKQKKYDDRSLNLKKNGLLLLEFVLADERDEANVALEGLLA